VISPSQRPLPDNTKHSQQTDIHAPARFEPTIPASEQPQTHALVLSNTAMKVLQALSFCIANEVKFYKALE